MISIRRRKREAVHEFPLISVLYESYHRGLHRSPWLTLAKVDLVLRAIYYSYFSLKSLPSNDSSPFLDMPLENRNSAINDRDVEVDRTE